MSIDPRLAKEICGNCRKFSFDEWTFSEGKCVLDGSIQKRNNPCNFHPSEFESYAVPPRELGGDMKAKDLEENKE